MSEVAEASAESHQPRLLSQRGSAATSTFIAPRMYMHDQIVGYVRHSLGVGRLVERGYDSRK